MTAAERNSEVTPFAPVSELHVVVDNASRRAEPESGRLVAAVGALRGLEDDMVAVLTEADGILESLSRKRVYADVGFASFREMERRLLDPSSMLHAMRLAVPCSVYQPKSRRRRTSSAAAPAKERARTINGLSVLSQAVATLRSLDERLRGLADAARVALNELESDRLYEECGYSSLEDFLERVIAPSPVLAATLALLSEEPVPPPLPEPSDALISPSESLVDLSDVSIVEAQAAGNDFLATGEGAGADASGSAQAAPEGAPAAKPQLVVVLVSLGLAVVAAVAGGAAGFVLH